MTRESLCHHEDLVKARKVLEAHLRGEIDHFSVEIRMRHKVGDWVWVLDQGAVIQRDETGEALRVSGTHIDITAIKQEQERLTQQQKTV